MAGEIGDYCGIDFIGGGLGAVDKIDGAVLQDKDHFLVVTPTIFAPLSLDADSGAGENSPQFIAPNTNPGDKRWILVGGVFANLTVYDNVGIGTITPNIIGTQTDNDSKILNIYEGTNKARVVIQGQTGAFLDLVDLDGGGDDKRFGLRVDAGIGKFSSLKDDGSAFIQDNIIVLDLGTGKVGFGTPTPGTPGYAKIHLKGMDSSSTGPHMIFETSADAYPLMQIFNFAHDNIDIKFDAYYDGTERSSDAGSNARIHKRSDKLIIKYDSGIAQGAAITWNDAIAVDLTDGKCGFGGNISPAEIIDVDGNINVTGVYKVDYVQVVGNQGAIVANATDPATTMARLNDLLARCRAHGLIAT